MSNYTARTTAPDVNDKRWIQLNSGGYNACIYGSSGPPSVLPNCTGYVHGRVMEIRGVNTDDAGLSFGNGADYYNGSSADWIQQSTPSLGAIVCYSGGAGHVAVVEKIIDSDTIEVSESSYSNPAVYFRYIRCYRSLGWRPIVDASLSFQGFLKNKYPNQNHPI